MPLFTCTKCSKELPLDGEEQRCPVCNEPLEVRYESMPKTDWNRFPLEKSALLRYAEVLPFKTYHDSLSLAEGGTPLVAAEQLGAQLGIRSLYLKNEGLNPTGSFKDRGTACALQHVAAVDKRVIGTVSTGNMAASVAAYAAKAGLDCFVLVKESTSDEKLAEIRAYGPTVVRVDGDYGELYFRSLELGKRLGIYFVNSDNPFRVEGQKTIAFEIVQQLLPALPDVIVVPVSSGGNISAIIKGLEEMVTMRLIDRVPRLVAVQAEGCSPIARAYNAGGKTVGHFGRVDTVAHAISNPSPPSGDRVLQKLRLHDGTMVTVKDDEIIQAQRELARYAGILGQPASAAPIAAVKKLIADGSLDSDQTVVAVVTGHGLKDPGALKRLVQTTSETVPLDGLDTFIREYM